MAKPLSELVGAYDLNGVQYIRPKRRVEIEEGLNDLKRKGVLIKVRVRPDLDAMPARMRARCHSLFKQATSKEGVVKVVTGRRYDNQAQCTTMSTIDVKVGDVLSLPPDTALFFLNVYEPSLIFEEVDDGAPSSAGVLARTGPLLPGELAKLDKMENAIVAERSRVEAQATEIAELKGMVQSLLALVQAGATEADDNETTDAPPKPGRRK